MGQQQSSAFYDSRLATYLLPYEESPWRPVYDAVLSLLPENREVRILDVGCATGRFAEAVQRAGYHRYVGFNFSPNRVREAQRYVPHLTFYVLDAFSDEASSLFEKADVTVITEVLEHLKEDRALLDRVPRGTEVIISVPNFDSEAHVRHFKSSDAVIERYGSQVEFDRSKIIEIVSGKRMQNRTFVLRGKRLETEKAEPFWRRVCERFLR